MTSSSVRDALARHGLAAHRDRGQNFLVDPSRAEALVTHAGVEPGDAVIEIGPGLGLFTRALAARARNVVAIEIDAGLVRALSAEGDLPGHVRVLHADALEVDLADLARSLGPPVHLVGNLPYAISSPLLRRFLDLRGVVQDVSVMVQREVAERITAAPGTRDYGSLAVLHALCVTASRGIDLAASDFFPPPRVRSRFLRLVPRADAPDAPTLRAIERVARAAFGQRRKQVANALRGGLAPVLAASEILRALHAAAIDPQARAESIAPECFASLALALGAEP